MTETGAVPTPDETAEPPMCRYCEHATDHSGGGCSWFEDHYRDPPDPHTHYQENCDCTGLVRGMSGQQHGLLRRWVTEGYATKPGDPALTFADILAELDYLSDELAESGAQVARLRPIEQRAEAWANAGSGRSARLEREIGHAILTGEDWEPA